MLSAARRFLFALSLVLIPTASIAQTTSTVLGVVRDSSGGVLPGASITVKHLATNAVRTVMTEGDGNYLIPFLAVGEYEVTAELSGFQTLARRISVAVDQRIRVDLTMQVGAIAETATVVGESPLVETSSSDIGTIIDNRRIVELPLNGRNFIALNALDAGAATRTGAAGSYFQMFGGAYSFSGSPGDASTYTADGIAMKGQGDSRVTMKLTIDTIQEFKQQQALFSAESGGSANVNVITRSGTNQLRWSAWEFNRDSKFDAPNYFDQGQKPPFSLNQFGGTIGGQIVKDRTFYFGSYEGTRITKSVGRAFTVPALALRAGDFRGRNTIYDPATTRPDPNRPGQFIRDPFPNNVIPADRIDPVAKATLDMLFPLPDRAGNVQNLFAPLRNDTTEDQMTVRVDHQFSARNTTFGRYSMTDPRRYNTSFANLPNYADWWNTKAHNAVISNTSVFSQRLVNEFRAGYNRMFQYLVATDQRDIPSMLGITGTQSDIYPGPPTISISGYDSTASLSNTPNNRLEQTYVLSDKVSYSAGKHAVGFGMELKKLLEDGGNRAGARGTFSFTTRFTTQPGVSGTGDPMAEFLLGYPSSATTARGDGYSNIRQSTADFYVKDDWQVNGRLTLNIGLRYEYASPLTETLNRLPNFDEAAGVLVPVGPDGLMYNRDLNNFAPRIGFAYQPFGTGKTVVRGGYGIFYSEPMTYMGWSAGSTLRQGVTVTANPTIPNITLANAFPEALRVESRNITVINRDLRTPYNQQFTVGIQRELATDLVLDMAYLGNIGRSLISGSQRNINQPPPGPGAVAGRRPYPNFATISVFESDGLSDYHALRTGLQRRFRGGFSLNVSHVWSHMLDTTGTSFLAEGTSNAKRDVHNRAAEYGNSIFDARHRLVVSYVVELPFHGAVAGGWQLSGVTTFQTGTPVDTGMSFDNANTGSTGDNRPDRIGDPNTGPRTPQQWFNTAAFAAPAPFTFGNTGKDVITGPGIKTTDFSVIKNVGVGKAAKLQLRFEVFNLLNNTNFSAPNATFGTAQFGVISSAGEAREIQLGLKFTY
jgi:carboxypeptidase family protein